MEEKIIPYIEPIYRFCYKRVRNRYDAEDLASEIVCHVLEGMGKYNIESLDAWVWRIAHNRYARFVDSKNKNLEMPTGDDSVFEISNDDDYCFIDEEAVERNFDVVFKYLHTLSKQYRDIFVDYYIGELSVRELSKKYSLTETTVKWRLNVGREKIKKRIGENDMDRMYKRINWNTTACNGCVDTNRYLHSQIARAICKAAYEKTVTIEEISLATGIPAVYIEDELPALEYGEAIAKVGENKYATNFIIFSLENRRYAKGASEQLVKLIADKFKDILNKNAEAVGNMCFYGHDFGIERLGFIAIHYILRKKLFSMINNNSQILFPPRRDGGYGWFIVNETEDGEEQVDEYDSGCNLTEGENIIYYYWLGRYHVKSSIYQANRVLSNNNLLSSFTNGFAERSALSDEDAAFLIENGIIAKAENGYRLSFACFTQEQFNEFISLFDIDDDEIESLLKAWVNEVKNNFKEFVPKRLESQIDQWINCYAVQLIAYVIYELINIGALNGDDSKKPLTHGVFSVSGKYIDP